MPKKPSNFVPMILVCLLLMAGVLLRPRGLGGGGDHSPQPLPPLAVEGWLNADAAPDLEGKIVVLDAWFTTCPPCLQSLPKLARLHERWGGDDRVRFIGLTFEDEGKLPQVQAVIDRTEGFRWPVGYGAGPTLQMLGINSFPTLMVFDANGTSVWSGHNVDALSQQLDSML